MRTHVAQPNGRRHGDNIITDRFFFFFFSFPFYPQQSVIGNTGDAVVYVANPYVYTWSASLRAPIQILFNFRHRICVDIDISYRIEYSDHMNAI